MNPLGEPLVRCSWCPADPVYMAYHDLEWGVPVYEDSRLMEMLILEGAQAGLSWITILRKRDDYRRAFKDFDLEELSRYGEREIEEILNNPGIVRNRAKVTSAINNARLAMKIKEEKGSLASFLWSFVGGRPIQNRWLSWSQVSKATAESRAMARELKDRGFKFVGPTICYSFMQAVGMVNDHEMGCFRHGEIATMASEGLCAGP